MYLHHTTRAVETRRTVQTSCNKEMSFINFVKRYGKYKPRFIGRMYIARITIFNLELAKYVSERERERNPDFSYGRDIASFRGRKTASFKQFLENYLTTC